MRNPIEYCLSLLQVPRKMKKVCSAWDYRLICIQCGHSTVLPSSCSDIYCFVELYGGCRICPDCGVPVIYDVRTNQVDIRYRMNWKIRQARQVIHLCQYFLIPWKFKIREEWEWSGEYLTSTNGSVKFSETKSSERERESPKNIKTDNGVNFTREEIVHAHKFLVKKAHPDCGGDEIAFRFVEWAYGVAVNSLK